MSAQQPTAGWETAYDAVTWQDMPKDGAHFLYVDGDYAAPAEAHTAYPDAYTIAIDPGTPADEYDVEKGNPNHPVTWAVMMRQNHGYRGRIYCSEASVPGVLDQFTTAGIAPPTFRIADWTGTAPAEVTAYGAGTDGVQYASGATYDTSLIRPGLAHYTTAAAPAATTPEEDDMMTASNADGSAVLSWPAGRVHVIQVIAEAGQPLELAAEFADGSSSDKTDGTWSPGTLVASGAGQIVYEIPTDKIKACRGVVLKRLAGSGYYSVCGV